jgi:uncharacterized protein (TIGR03546 family)
MAFNPWYSIQSLAAALQGDETPDHLAAGFALGAAMGLVPKGNLFGLIFFLLFFFFRVDKGLALLTAFIFTPVGFILDPVAHAVGLALLTAEPLKPVWTLLYNLPVVPFTRFNNTVVLGNLVIGLALFWPLFALFRKAVFAYRATWKERLDRTPAMKAIKSWGWVQSYLTWREKLKALQ